MLNLSLENRLADRIGLLSGGQRQAVSLLMASLKPSRILLLDAPDLLRMFERTRGEKLDGDKLLLA